MPSTITVPGRKIEYDEGNWKEVLGGEYRELCQCVLYPGQNRSVEVCIERIAKIMVDLVWNYGVDFLEMTDHLFLQHGKFSDEEDLQRVSGKEKMASRDYDALERRIFELYAYDMTQLALERRESAAQPDLQDSHTKAQHVLGARGRSSFPC